MRVLILGVTGFAGRYLARELVARCDDVWGAARLRGGQAPARLEVEGHAVSVLPCDVADRASVESTLAAVSPSAVVLLAGVAFPPAAHRDPAEAYRVHALGAVHLLEAVSSADAACRVLLVTSSEVYGVVDERELPITERTPLRPASVYGASKAAADMAGLAFASAKGCDVVRVRPFNHTGPGQRRDFVCPDFAAQVAAVAQGTRPPVMEVGNLSARRDFSDVRDIVRGYVAALDRGRSGEAYNLCSGRAIGIGEILRELCDLAGVEPEVRTAEERMRKAEVSITFGSAEKARVELGWQPEVPLRRTLEDLLIWSSAHESEREWAVE
jgi:GDP-4-dehydro-6-deoxy-D-mannose reductase